MLPTSSVEFAIASRGFQHGRGQYALRRPAHPLVFTGFAGSGPVSGFHHDGFAGSGPVSGRAKGTFVLLVAG